MSLFNEAESCAAPNAPEPELVEVRKHLRQKKYAGQREEMVKSIPHSKVLHTIDESEQTCEKCGSIMVKSRRRIRPYRGTVYPGKAQSD